MVTRDYFAESRGTWEQRVKLANALCNDANRLNALDQIKLYFSVYSQEDLNLYKIVIIARDIDTDTGRIVFFDLESL